MWHVASSMHQRPGVALAMQDGVTAPLYQERDELVARLAQTEELLAEVTLEKENVSDERTQLQYQVTRLQDKLEHADTYASFASFLCADSVACDTTAVGYLVCQNMNLVKSK